MTSRTAATRSRSSASDWPRSATLTLAVRAPVVPGQHRRHLARPGTAGTVALTGTLARTGGGPPRPGRLERGGQPAAASASSYSRNGANSPHPAGPRSRTASRVVTPRKRTRIGICTTRNRREHLVEVGPVGRRHAPILADVSDAPSSSTSGVSETFDPTAWARCRGLRLHRHHLPPRALDGPARHGADRVRPAGGAQRLPPAHRRRALPRARPRPDDPGRRRGAAHRQRPAAPRTAAGRSAPAATSGSAAAAATSTPSGETADTVDQARVKAAGGRLHILEVQRLIRTMPKVVIAVVHGWAAGGGHTPARRLRPDHRQPRARPVQADRRRRRLLRRRLRLGVPGQDGRAEVRPRDLLPRAHLLRRGHAADGRGQHRRRPRRPRDRGAAGGRARSTARAPPRSGC